MLASAVVLRMSLKRKTVCRYGWCPMDDTYEQLPSEFADRLAGHSLLVAHKTHTVKQSLFNKLLD